MSGDVVYIFLAFGAFLLTLPVYLVIMLRDRVREDSPPRRSLLAQVRWRLSRK